MTRFLRKLGLSALLGCCSNCGGHSLDLDQATPNVESAGAGGVGAVQSVALKHIINEFFVDEGQIFAQVDGARIQSCAFAQCASAVSDFGISATYAFYALSADDLYFAQAQTRSKFDDADLLRCSRAACQGGPEYVFGDHVDSVAGWSVVVDEKYVYWGSTLDILRCPLSGCGEVPELVAKGQNTLQIDQSRDRLYYMGFDSALRAVTVQSVPKDGSAAPTTLAPAGESSSDGVRVDAMNAYWVNGTAHHIESCPLAGCNGSPTTLVATDTPKNTLKVDAAGLYWIEVEDEKYSVRFCPLVGCPPGSEPSVLVADAVHQYQLDSTYLYWINALEQSNAVDPFSTLYRVAKPTPAR